MVGLVKLAALKEAFQYEKEGSELWVLFHELFHKLDTVDAVFSVEAEICIDPSQLVLELDDRAFGILDGLN